MIKFHHKIHRYGSFFCEILCCDCFFDEVYFLLRKKEDDGEKFEEKFENNNGCFISFFDETIVVICANVLKFVRDQKQEKLFKNICITDVVLCDNEKIILCSICTIDLFKKLDILHSFTSKWFK